jgi:hypothetical protein
MNDYGSNVKVSAQELSDQLYGFISDKARTVEELVKIVYLIPIFEWNDEANILGLNMYYPNDASKVNRESFHDLVAYICGVIGYGINQKEDFVKIYNFVYDTSFTVEDLHFNK